MDTQQLKLWAARTRDLLAQAQHVVGHNQSLDVIAALPGLRSWPEVMAFPERVQATPLDLTATGRLAFRLTRKFGLNVSASELLDLLRPSRANPTEVLQLWPAGPAPGVYVTTNPLAIDALLTKYEDATDGALVYAEAAGNHRAGSIDLGEYGLWSQGLHRAPSGTLIVVGPVNLNQSEWTRSAERLEMACLKAQVGDHRVAVLVNTPTPSRLHEDLQLMVRSVENADDAFEAFVGVVTDDGDLTTRTPFAPSTVAAQRPAREPQLPSLAALPDAALDTLRPALSRATSGLVIVGSALTHDDHAAMPFVEAALALTAHAGPAARILSRKRRTPAKDWNVPEHIQALPFLPSVQSAYDQGIRRMVIDPTYTNDELLLSYDDVLFIACAWGLHCEDVLLSATRMARREDRELLPRILAILAATPIMPVAPEIVVTDLYVRRDHVTLNAARLADVVAFIQASRTLKYEEQLDALLAAGTLTLAQLEAAFPHERTLRTFLDGRAPSNH